jgi:hypothetical protein
MGTQNSKSMHSFLIPLRHKTKIHKHFCNLGCYSIFGRPILLLFAPKPAFLDKIFFIVPAKQENSK